MQLVMMIGLQGSGKSTFCRQYFVAPHLLVSKDLLRNNRRPTQRQQRLIDEALQAGRDVVVDNTNLSREERVALIAQGHQYGATVSGYFFPVDVKKSLERNRQRQGKQRVPDVAIFAALKRLVLPELSEGFDQLFLVTNQDEMGFSVSPWTAAP